MGDGQKLELPPNVRTPLDSQVSVYDQAVLYVAIAILIMQECFAGLGNF